MPLVTGPCKTAIFAGENFGNALKCRCRVNLKPRTYDCRVRLDEKVECGRGHLLALKSGEKARDLLEGMIVDILENIVVAFPRDVRREVANHYGYRGGESTISAALTRYVEKGIVRRLPQSLYCLPSVADVTLMHALKLHDHTIQRTLEDPSLTDYPLDDLSLLARYFYQQE